MSPALKYLGPVFLFVGLTALTQVGGFAYLLGLAIGFIPPIRHCGLLLRRTTVFLASVAIYVLMTVFLVPPLAQSTGRIRLPCSTHSDGLIVAATSLTCALNRGYVRREVLALVEALGGEVAQRFPGSRATTLEGNFPFLDGFPLLLHLSHRDGKKVDVAFFYLNGEDIATIANGSPSWSVISSTSNPVRETHCRVRGGGRHCAGISHGSSRSRRSGASMSNEPRGC